MHYRLPSPEDAPELLPDHPIDPSLERAVVREELTALAGRARGAPRPDAGPALEEWQSGRGLELADVAACAAVGHAHAAASVEATADVARAAVALRDPRRAIADHEILCLVCGEGFRHLTNTHLAGHGLISMEYKRRFGYNVRRPLMCRALVRFYAETIRIGLAALIRRRPILGDPGLGRVGGARPIAREERLTRQDVQRRPRRRWSLRDERGRFARRSIW